MQQENKNQLTLYRFVSLRSPELSKKEDQEKRFVFHPNNKTGFFYDIVNNKPEDVTNWEAMYKASVNFPAFENESDIQSLNEEFYNTSEWIARNRSNLDVTELREKINSLEIFQGKVEEELWDNLFYQVVTQKSFYIKEALMQVLVLQNLIKQKKKSGEKFLPILANAKVVLPQNLFSGNLTAHLAAEKRELNDDENIVIDNDVLNAQLIQSSKNNIENFESLIEELRIAEKNYFDEYFEKFTDKVKSHQEEIAPILEEYTRNYISEKRKLCSNPRDEYYDPNDFCNQPYVESPVIPEFVFNAAAEFNIQEIQAQLSRENFSILNELIGSRKVTTFQDAIDLITKAINKDSLAISNRTIATEKTIAIGDTVISTNKIVPITSGISFQICSGKLSNGNVSVYMSLQLPNNTYNISQFNYSLQTNINTSIAHSSYIKVFNGNVLTLSNLFNNSLSFADNGITTGINGTIKFTNGQQFSFTVNPFTLTGCYQGRLLPEVVEFPDPENPTDVSTFIPKGFGYKQLGIADYKKVVAEVCCYDAGEVAHIENVMASELRSKVTTKSYKSEVTDFESTEIEKENMTDVVSTERFEMQTEVSKLLDEQKQLSAYADVHSSWGNTTLDAGAAYASTISKEESNRQAVTQAKELTQRAVERIVSRVKTEKTIKITNEFVETNTHVFDNTGGQEHISGVFRFINAIYKNQIFNYGKRLMYEFTVPQPSKLHRLAMQVANNNENAVVLDKPIDPATLGITDFTKITATNYQNLASKYNAEVEIFPKQELYIGKSIEHFVQSSNTGATKTMTIKIPEGYYSEKANATITGMIAVGSWDKRILVTIGDITINSVPFRIDNVPYQFIKKYSDEIPVAISITDYFTVNVTVNVLCKIADETTLKWKKDTYEQIIKGYQEQLRIYNEKLLEAKVAGNQILDSNPLFYRQIEQMVLRKNCISYLLDNSPTSLRRFGKKMYTGDSIMNHQVTASAAMDDYGSFAKFMEQAFEWNLMSYNFYPYYWGYDAEWSSLYQHESNDPIFRSFMQAGMARVVVTVKPGFEDAIMHYLTTGQIWNGGQTPILGDPLYLSIIDELKEQEYTVEETWETVVPTHLIGLQRTGVSVDEDGLPCSCPVVEELNKSLVMNDNVLMAK